MIRRITYAALLAGAAALLAGCTGRGGYTATVYAEKPGYYETQPTMVPIRDDVWVVEGRSYPVFYSHGTYWRYDDGYWYRSSYVNDGFVRVHAGVVPRSVRYVDRPGRYVRYRAPSRGRVRVIPPGHVHQRGEVRRRQRYERDTVRVREPRDRYRQRRHRR